MKIITDESCTGYSRPGHPEKPTRISRTLEKLRAQTELPITWAKPGIVEDAAILRAHTPELLARSRSADDDVAEAAAARWEKAIAAYNARLQKIRPFLPPGARQLLRRVSLHDAQYLLEGGAGSELFLTFRLAKGASESATGVELRTPQRERAPHSALLQGRHRDVLHAHAGRKQHRRYGLWARQHGAAS